MKIRVEKYDLNSVDSVRVFNKYFEIIKCFVMKQIRGRDIIFEYTYFLDCLNNIIKIIMFMKNCMLNIGSVR